MPLSPIFQFTLSPTLQNLGWQFSEMTKCWHFLIQTGSETGTGLDLVFNNVIRYDWFISDREPEMVTHAPIECTEEELIEMTNELIAQGF